MIATLTREPSVPCAPIMLMRVVGPLLSVRDYRINVRRSLDNFSVRDEEKLMCVDSSLLR